MGRSGKEIFVENNLAWTTITGKRNLYRSKHPFDDYPFEAFFDGSWQTVELLRINDGIMILHFLDGGFAINKKGPFSNLRIRSRKATLTDCTCFLRPGIDVCALSTLQRAEDSEKEHIEPVWIDAKIDSIKRKPHESCCNCQFYIKLYETTDSLGTEKATLSKEIEVVDIDEISILQKLGRSPCEDEYYRWDFSEDCSSTSKAKLFLGKFASDLSWLLVASVLKKVSFDIRSVQNKIVYQILGDNFDARSLSSDKQSNMVNFKVDNGISIPIVVPLAPADNFQEHIIHDEMCAVGSLSFYDLMDLRRSKRRNVQPERFLGEGSLIDTDTTSIRMPPPYRPDKWKNEEVPLIALNQFEDLTDKRDSYENFLVSTTNTKSRRVKSSKDQIEHQNQLAIVPLPAESCPFAREKNYFEEEISGNQSGEIGDIISKYIYVSGTSTIYGKNNSGIWKRSRSNKKVQKRWVPSVRSKRASLGETKTCRKRSFSASYNEVIKTYMKNIELTIKKEEPKVLDQWKEFHATKCFDQRQSKVAPSIEEVEEVSENEMLWRELEMSLASSYLFEDDEVSSNTGASAGDAQKTSKGGGQFCQHVYKLDEEIGVICQLCGFVSTEIKEVLPPFMQSTGWVTNTKLRYVEDSEYKQAEGKSFDLHCDSASSDAPLSKESDSVWTLVPDLGVKLRIHQKRAFEFLWQNIAGSLVPARMESAVKKRGGCVISHSPGAGKTLLIIAFLVSYLKLFPGKRPLVLAPKTTLYTWYKEIIKWDVPIPVYQVHDCRTYRYEVCSPRTEGPLGDRRPGRDVMHLLDCLEKIRKWHSHPSILLMGYTSFLSLTREDSKLTHRRYMGELLRESPGILVLDEGHNPRSTKSRLRKALMKVKTNLRVLLSGTLFQNNFGEYFNTLSLARPSFINEVLKELDPNFRKNKRGLKQTPFAIENRARKLFTEMIASKINSSTEKDRIEGLNMLRSMTSGFIDVHEGGTSDNLPGLQCYTLVMKPTPIQQQILVKLQEKMNECNGYPLELELLITLGSIHPWLIKTAACVDRFFSEEEVEALEKHKFALNKGSKVKFVVSLVQRSVIRKEKVLIFCHNIAPMNLFLEIFGWMYGWRKNEEILVLQGELELFERGRVMDKFEDPAGNSRILLASISACAEGISLTAASRVILLDTEWNPSKRKQAIARAFRPGQEREVYVYQLLVTGTLEENKYGRTTYKEWVSSMIFNEDFVEDPAQWQAEIIEDDLLREIVEEDRARSFHMITKNEKASNPVVRDEKRRKHLTLSTWFDSVSF